MSLLTIQFENLTLRERWRSPFVDPWLRAVIVFTMMLYREQGAKRFRLLDIETSGYGRVATVSILGLPGIRRTTSGEVHKSAAWVVNRLNVLFPFWDGQKETASCDGYCIRLEVPFNGYGRDCLALREWPEWGPKKEKLRPRRIRMVEP